MSSIKDTPEKFSFDAKFKVGNYRFPDQFSVRSLNSKELRDLADDGYLE